MIPGHTQLHFSRGEVRFVGGATVCIHFGLAVSTEFGIAFCGLLAPVFVSMCFTGAWRTAWSLRNLRVAPRCQKEMFRLRPQLAVPRIVTGVD